MSKKIKIIEDIEYILNEKYPHFIDTKTNNELATYLAEHILNGYDNYFEGHINTYSIIKKVLAPKLTEVKTREIKFFSKQLFSYISPSSKYRNEHPYPYFEELPMAEQKKYNDMVVIATQKVYEHSLIYKIKHIHQIFNSSDQSANNKYN